MPLPRGSVIAGADGALGSLLLHTLGGRGVCLRCPGPELGQQRLAELAEAPVVVGVTGPRVRPGLSWTDYFREHVGCAEVVARSMRPGSHLIHFSSAAVYGGWRGETIGPDTPEAPGLFPTAAYACAKLAAELTIRAICAERGVGLSVLRPPLVYGPGVGSALESLLALGRRGVFVQLHPASVRQHLLHVSLLARAVEVLAESGPRGPAPLVPADPFVLTNGDLNRAICSMRRSGVPFPVSLTLAQSVLRLWPGRPARAGPGTLEALAALAIDNEYDSRAGFGRLGLDSAEFGRERSFDAYVAGRT